MPQTFNVGSRSLFVSITAWVFIVLGAAASTLALIQTQAPAPPNRKAITAWMIQFKTSCEVVIVCFLS